MSKKEGVVLVQIYVAVRVFSSQVGKSGENNGLSFQSVCSYILPRWKKTRVSIPLAADLNPTLNLFALGFIPLCSFPLFQICLIEPRTF